jgi:hypothetical protein
MAERKTGAGSRLSGVLERALPPDSPEQAEPDELEVMASATEPMATDSPAVSKGKVAAAKRNRSADARAAKRIKGRTIYLPDDLFERIIVQAHRRNRTISEYVTAILDRQVPEHRGVRDIADPAA